MLFQKKKKIAERHGCNKGHVVWPTTVKEKIPNSDYQTLMGGTKDFDQVI